MTKHLILSAVLSLCLFAPAASAQTVPSDHYDQIHQQARRAMWWGDFETLERMHSQLQRPDRKRTTDGRYALLAFHAGLYSNVLSTLQAKNGYFQQVDDLTLQWAREHPTSPFAHVVHANALYRHGFSHRGGEYADKVPADAMKEFQRYIGMAIKYLLEHQATAMQISEGHATLLDLGRMAGWGLPQLWNVAKRGLSAHPGDERLMRAMVEAALPKWGGDPVVLDKTINDLATMSDAADADIHYARLYGFAADLQFGHALFQASGADWGRMKRGYRQFLERYPAPINANRFAYFACMARDKPTLQEMLERVGPEPTAQSWGTNGLRVFEGCKRLASAV